MSENTSPASKTYFGVAALVTGILCVLSLLTNYGVSQLNITPETFNILNPLTALFYCVLTQVTIVLGIIGYRRKNDAKNLSLVGIGLAVFPFLIVFGGFIISFSQRP
ncbi:MAG: hypothetical protein HY865_06720 [Chloroflexi bacterium]|nr:hypothetical protein [Chloroflexota bacterium]